MSLRSIRSQLAPWSLAALSIAAASCQDAIEPLAPGRVPERAQDRALVAAPGQEALVGSISGFGGLFVDVDGTPTVYVTEPAEAPD
ncbi:MAG: hypothetical protein ACRELC_06790, partial [Gemmatimonadota bacterium]